MKKITLIAIMLVVLLSQSTFAQDKDIRSELDFARKAIKDGFYDQAESKLNSILGKGVPKEIEGEVHLLLGRVYFSTDLPAKALSEFSIIIDSFRDADLDARATYWMAEVYFKESDYKQALAEYQKVIKQYPASEYVPYSYYSQAWCYEKLGESDAAIESFREVLKFYPDSELAVKAAYKLAEILYSTIQRCHPGVGVLYKKISCKREDIRRVLHAGRFLLQSRAI